MQYHSLLEWFLFCISKHGIFYAFQLSIKLSAWRHLVLEIRKWQKMKISQKWKLYSQKATLDWGKYDGTVSFWRIQILTLEIGLARSCTIVSGFLVFWFQAKLVVYFREDMPTKKLRSWCYVTYKSSSYNNDLLIIFS